MNKFVIAAIVIAIISVLSFVLPVHPAFGITGMIVSLFTALWGFGKMEEEGLLS